MDDPDAEFRFGLERVLDGVEALVRYLARARYPRSQTSALLHVRREISLESTARGWATWGAGEGLRTN